MNYTNIQDLDKHLSDLICNAIEVASKGNHYNSDRGTTEARTNTYSIIEQKLIEAKLWVNSDE